MSDPVTLVLAKPSPRGFARTLVLGTLLIGAAMSMHRSSAPLHLTPLDAARPVFLRLIDARPAMPSAYDLESQMNQRQLLARWDGFITEASQRFHIPKAWIRAVMRQESGGRTMLAADKPIVSRAGAVGLMQVMPATYDEMAAEHKLGGDPFNAHDNIMAGAAYLRWLHARYGYPRMFAAYNAGPGRVEAGGKLPAETRAYLSNIARTLKVSPSETVRLTRPDGATVRIAAEQVTSVRAPLPGEYGPAVKAVLKLGKRNQAVCEDVAAVSAAIRAAG